MFINNSKYNKGFTLVETLITLAIFSVILGAIGLFARNIYYYNTVFSGGLASYDDAKKVLQPIASEIRSASQSSLGAYAVESAGDTSFIFFTDINNDGLKERIRYFLTGSTFQKGVISPTGSPLQYVTANEKITNIMSNVRNGATPIFSYYDSSYNGTTAPLTQPVSITTIRLIKITLVIDTDPNRSPLSVTATTEVSLRNLKDNL